jgi:hypothetical protein
MPMNCELPSAGEGAGLRSGVHAAASPKSAPDLSYDLPPADECKGETGTESDRDLGNPIVAHRSTLIRHPAGRWRPQRQKNVVGKGTDLDIDTRQSGLLRVTRTPRQLLVNHLRRCFRSRIGGRTPSPQLAWQCRRHSAAGFSHVGAGGL